MFAVVPSGGMADFHWMFLLFGLSVVGCMHRRSDASPPAARGASSASATPSSRRNFALAPAVHSGNSATSALLAEHGVARMPIVVSTKAAPDTRRAADELSRFLGLATSAHFDVTTGDGSRGIVVGTAQEFDIGKDAPALAIKDAFDGREAFVVRSEPGRVLLVGAATLGVSHAVYAFLESVGFRWLFPAKEWQEIPDLPTLRVDVHLTDRPRFLSRSMGPGWGFFDSQAKGDWETWSRRNRLGESLPARVGHAWYAIIARNKKEFDAHPEYFALSNGKRLTDKLCVTNPGVQKIAIAYAMWALGDPSVEMVSLESSDGTGYCDCERCKAIGPPSAQPFFLANVVAKEVQKRHPGKLVGMLAYADHSEPPPFSLEPNILVEITNGYNYGQYSVAELAELWPKVAHYLGYYEYFSVYQGDADMFPGMPSADPAHLAGMLRFYAAHSGIAFTAETGNNWGLYGRAYYAASRLLWNPDADVSAVLGDFYASAFHAAAPAMKRFYERFDPGNHPFMCRSLLRSGYADVADATRAARGDAQVQSRLDHIKGYLHYVFSQYALTDAKDPDTRRRLALDVLTEAYRTRRSYMNHWRALWTDYSPKAAKEFKEPSWSRATPGAHPWAVDALILHSDLEKRFEQEMAALPARTPAREVAFSNRLVRVREDSEARRRTEKTLFQFVTAQRFALSSDAGSPSNSPFKRVSSVCTRTSRQPASPFAMQTSARWRRAASR
jgi:hypothetical protein